MAIGQELCNEYRGFECAVCGNRRYYRVVVLREPQKPYRTDFYGCVGCSAMFTDPYQFTQAVKGKENTGNYGSSTYHRAPKA